MTYRLLRDEVNILSIFLDIQLGHVYDPWKVTGFFRQVLQRLEIHHYILGDNIKDIGRRVEWTIDTAGLDAVWIRINGVDLITEYVC